MSQFKIKPHTGKTVIGIDVGGSTTKIAAFSPEGKLVSSPLFIRATDPVTAVYGAFGRFTLENRLALSDIDRVMMTGAGANHITDPIYGLDCRSASEFDCIGVGGLYLSGLDEAIIVSMGTGTAIIHAKKADDTLTSEYLGGTGVGGGTVIGLSRKMLGIENVEHLEQISDGGDLSRVDLRVGDISRSTVYQNVNAELTASNFGNLSDLASRHDIALGIFNMVGETVAMMAIFAARSFGIKDIVLTGNLTTIGPIRRVFEGLAPIFNVNFLIPDMSQYGTVIGAALQ